jgi:transcriptional regulator with AAA-type ATPase domain
MSQELQPLVEVLLESRHFEEAAEQVLRRMLQLTEQALAASRYARRGRLLRGIIHLRSGEAYRGLVVVELAPSVEPGESAPIQASATAWHAVTEHRSPIFIDIGKRVLQPHRSGFTQKERLKQPELHVRFSNPESPQLFLKRQVTHACVLPLRMPGGMVEGMVSLEANCLAAVGEEFIWGSCVKQLQLLADVAAPYVAGLPLLPVAGPQGDEFLPVVGKALAQLLPLLKVFARQDETVLISGPTGSGKSRLARWCHEQSSRQRGPFVVLDLMTVPEELQMAELTGWRRGAFTGAVKDSPGSVARAEKGTLFIDEIDKLSLKAQAGLLRLLEERRYHILGEATDSQRADVRFLIGTNANLREAVREGRFREDLYYRINVLPIAVPPLDERQDEIAAWAHYMLNRRHRDVLPDSQAGLSPEAQQRLATTRWPGNLRELDNIIRRAYTFAMAERPPALRLQLEDRHVQQALAYEQVQGSSPLVKALTQAALAFFREAQQRPPGTLSLELAESFSGFALGVAAQQIGRDKALLLFGGESTVKGRNQLRVFRRELKRVEKLLKALGYEGAPFAQLLSDEDTR